MKGRPFGSGSKCLGVIKAWPLGKSLSNKPCFVSLNGPISIALDLEHPSAPNGFLPRRQLHKFKCAILHQCLDLILSSLVPLCSLLRRSLHCLMERTWFIVMLGCAESLCYI